MITDDDLKEMKIAEKIKIIKKYLIHDVHHLSAISKYVFIGIKSYVTRRISYFEFASSGLVFTMK